MTRNPLILFIVGLALMGLALWLVFDATFQVTESRAIHQALAALLPAGLGVELVARASFQVGNDILADLEGDRP